MPPVTRRTVLRSALGATALGVAGSASGRLPPRFTTTWTTRPVDGAGVTDSLQRDDGRVVLALRSATGEERTDRPRLLGLDVSGRRAWTWRWPTDRSPPLDYPGAVAPATEGGLFVVGPVREAEETFRVVELDAERTVVWSETFEHGRVPFSETHLVRASASRLAVVGTKYLPGGSWTSTVGIDTDDHTRRWESDSDRGRGVTATRPHPEGFVATGDGKRGGRVELRSPDGELVWGRRFTDGDLDVVEDVTVTGSGGVVGVGYHHDDGKSPVLFELGADGETAWRQPDPTEGLANPWTFRVLSDPAGGYVLIASLDGPDLFVAKTGDEGSVDYHSRLSPGDGPLRLEDAHVAGDRFAFVGDVDDDEATVWAAGATRSRETSTATPTDTPTVSPTSAVPETPAVTATRRPPATDTATATPTDASPPSEPTTADGPGFGVLGTALSALAVGATARLRGSDDGDGSDDQ